jgi:hypothetical protein
MKRSIHFRRLLATGIVAAATAVGPMAPRVQAAPNSPDVPSTIAVPAGNKQFLVAHGVGVQIYSCNGSAWGLVAPRANLYDDKGRLVITHFGGPTWRAMDGSTVLAARVDGVTVDPTAIPWLLLAKVSTTVGPDGDRLTNTTFIQRTETSGGLPPAAADCNATTTGITVEVPYTADYSFWKSSGH